MQDDQRSDNGQTANSRRAERMAAAWDAKRRNASLRPLTARAPAWLRLASDGKGFEPIPERAAIVRRIFEESAEGIGTNAIARRLNDEAIAPFGNSNGWQDSYIKKILANVAAMGTLQPYRCRDGKRLPEGPPVPGYFPAVIDEALFSRARQAIRARFVGAVGHKRKTHANLISGLGFCSVCGGPMRHFDKGGMGRQWLQCDNARRHAGCDHARKWPYSTLESGVVAIVRECETPADHDGVPVSFDLDVLAALSVEQRATARAALAQRLHQRIERITFFPQDVAALVLAGRRDIRLLKIAGTKIQSDPADLLIPTLSKPA